MNMENINKIAVLVFLYLVVLGLSLFYINSFGEEDVYLFYTINTMSFGMLDTLIVIVSYLGAFYVWLGFAAVSWINKNYTRASYVLTGIAVSMIPTFILKLVIMRPRPYEALAPFKQLVGEMLSSFPSADVVLIFTMMIVLTHLSRRYLVPMFILAIAVAFARVFVGVHYPFDVIFGALMGIILGIITINLPIEKVENMIRR